MRMTSRFSDSNNPGLICFAPNRATILCASYQVLFTLQYTNFGIVVHLCANSILSLLEQCI